jgi:hypothetical protein
MPEDYLGIFLQAPLKITNCDLSKLSVHLVVMMWTIIQIEVGA